MKLIERGVGVDAWEHAQVAHVVNLEGEPEVACPAQGAHQHLATLFLHRSVKTDLKERLCVHGGTASKFGVEHFFAELQLLAAHLCLLSPIAAELSEPVFRFVEIEHCRGILRHGDRFLLLV